jgi:glucosamine 6-phosphate synthetase-like amidotransferase/phosphosugar isomerase protein
VDGKAQNSKSAGEMKHGPNALIDETLPVVVIATKDPADPASVLKYEKTLSNIQEVTARSGRVIAIATEGDKHIHQLVEHVLEIPAAPSSSSPSSKSSPSNSSPTTSLSAAAATSTNQEIWRRVSPWSN